MILPIKPEAVPFLFSCEKDRALIADPGNRWKEGAKIHLWTGWPAAKGKPVTDPGTGKKVVLKCSDVLFATFLLRDYTCHLYLMKESHNSPPVEVIRWGTDDMTELAKLEGFWATKNLINHYFPGFEAMDPDEWKTWEGNQIFLILKKE